MVHPQSGRLYVVTKEKGRVRRRGDQDYEATNEVYEIKPGKATRVGQFTTRSVVTLGCLTTGGDFRRDGRAFVIRTYADAYEFTLRPGETMAAALERPPKKHPLPLEPQGEAICYRLDGKAWLTCSERVFGWNSVYKIPLGR